MATSHRQGGAVNPSRRGGGWLRRLWPGSRAGAGDRLYGRIVEQARRPEFYRDAGVPDTLDGRFDLIVLHVFLVLRRLRNQGPDARLLGQQLFDAMFGDMDRALREMGVGDLGVGRRVKDMVRAFYGRVEAYEAAIAGGDEAIREALTRNLYGGVPPRSREPDAMVEYFRISLEYMNKIPIADFLTEHWRFRDLPREPVAAGGGQEEKDAAIRTLKTGEID